MVVSGFVGRDAFGENVLVTRRQIREGELGRLFG